MYVIMAVFGPASSRHRPTGLRCAAKIDHQQLPYAGIQHP